MPNYQFPKDLEDIFRYYQKVNNSLSVNSDISSSNITSTKIIDPDVFFLKQSIPIMFFMAWEKFIRELKKDKPRYKVCFSDQAKPLRKFYNQDIFEISLIRNCLVHNDMCVSDDYITAFPGKFTLNQKLPEIDEFEIQRQYGIFNKAFERITTLPLTSLP